MEGYTKVCRGVHEGMWRGMQRYVEGCMEVHGGTQRCMEVCRGTQRYAEGCTEVCGGMWGVCGGMQRCV